MGDMAGVGIAGEVGEMGDGEVVRDIGGAG